MYLLTSEDRYEWPELYVGTQAYTVKYNTINTVRQREGKR